MELPEHVKIIDEGHGKILVIENPNTGQPAFKSNIVFCKPTTSRQCPALDRYIADGLKYGFSQHILTELNGIKIN